MTSALCLRQRAWLTESVHCRGAAARSAVVAYGWKGRMPCPYVFMDRYCVHVYEQGLKLMRQRSAFNRGFTIVELLTVMAIIAVLAGLIFASFSRAREAMRRTTCMNNLRQIGQGCIRYSVDYGDFFPTVFRPPTDASPVPSSPLKSLSLLYETYVPQRKLFVCPSTADLCLDLQAGTSFAPHGLAGRAQATDLKQTSYGYDDTKSSPLTNPEVAIAADAPAAPEENVGGVSTGGSAADQAVNKNSANHRRGPADRGGQNILFFNGNVRWSVTPYIEGTTGDTCIYDAADQTNPGDTDSYIHQQ